jgi:hypothetical protein
MIDILKDNYNFLKKTEKVQKLIACKYKKLYYLENISKDCSKE